MNYKHIKLIACETIIKEMSHLLPSDLETCKVESGLHLHSEKLKAHLQDMIDQITTESETIILGFGLCSMAAVGLKASDSTLVIPKVDDCIALFIGSQDFYKQQHKEEPGTYYLSKGWIDGGVTLAEELRHAEERLGKRAAEIVMKRMLANYTRLAYIYMDDKDQDKFREYSKTEARELGLRYDEIKGTTRLIEKMLQGPWDDEFIVAPPGHTILLKDFERNTEQI